MNSTSNHIHFGGVSGASLCPVETIDTHRSLTPKTRAI